MHVLKKLACNNSVIHGWSCNTFHIYTWIICVYMNVCIQWTTNLCRKLPIIKPSYCHWFYCWKLDRMREHPSTLLCRISPGKEWVNTNRRSYIFFCSAEYRCYGFMYTYMYACSSVNTLILSSSRSRKWVGENVRRFSLSYGQNNWMYRTYMNRNIYEYIIPYICE